MESIFFLALITIAAIVVYKQINKKSSKHWVAPTKEFLKEWKTILVSNVSFYNNLSKTNKKLFEFKVHEFLMNCRITGVETNITETDKILVAASAIIPIFSFPQWQYHNIDEVLIYPDSFNEQFHTSGENRSILGMVGTGYMEGKMILSQKALHHGFKNNNDKKNTAIHEFVHLIDKSDGQTDGIPSLLLEQQYVIPWIDLIHNKIDDIYKNESDINPYGATNKTEFFAVAAEYFFERPKLLKRKHPKLYQVLEKTFNQKLADKERAHSNREINRNDPCPCGSNKKHKLCCGKN